MPLLAAIVVATAVFVFVLAIAGTESKMRSRLEALRGQPRTPEPEGRLSLSERVLAPAFSAPVQQLKRLLPTRMLQGIEQRLILAGEPMTVNAFLIIRLVFLGIFLFSIGEMLTGPKKTEFFSLIAPPGDVRLIEPLAFGSDCLPTLGHIVVEKQDGRAVARLRPEQIANPVPGIDYDQLMYEPGDGSVTVASLIGLQGLDPLLSESNSHEIGRAFFVCEVHESVTSNESVLDSALRYLQGTG